MSNSIITGRINYKIFDLTHKGSTSIYSRFKFSDATKLAEIESNRNIVAQELGAEKIYLAKQVHGTKIIEVNNDTDFTGEEEADALITGVAGIVVAVQTADCVPILLFDQGKKLVAAIHSGWKSAKAGIIRESVRQMKNMGAGKIEAIIGPSIKQSSYEVDRNYYMAFIEDTKDNSKYFIPSMRPEHYMFDLTGYAQDRLIEEGVVIAKSIKDDTYLLPEKYPSYRRSCHTGEKYTHNILSAICIAR